MDDGNTTYVSYNGTGVTVLVFISYYDYSCRPGSSFGIATEYGLDGPESNLGGDEIFLPSKPAMGPPSLLYNGYRTFPGDKRQPECAADHSPPSSAAVMEE